jgi:hypothetical protein
LVAEADKFKVDQSIERLGKTSDVIKLKHTEPNKPKSKFHDAVFWGSSPACLLVLA